MDGIAENIIKSNDIQDFTNMLKTLHRTIHNNTQNMDLLITDITVIDFLNEIQRFSSEDKVDVYFGKTLRNIKLVLRDDNDLRTHEVLVYYKAPKKLIVTGAILPNFCLQNREYECIEDIVITFKTYLIELCRYFFELEHIDESCTVLEPLKPSFKDDYRRILIDERVWLHVELTREGLATNIHLVGHSEYWNNKLQKGLLSWDHDKNIVENIMTVFDLNHLPQEGINQSLQLRAPHEDKAQAIACGICLCDNLPEAGVPQPLCQNPTCGVYYHRICLYQWLVASAGSRPPAFGVASGACPTCLQPVTCSEKDN